MTCKHAETTVTTVPVLGPQDLTHRQTDCRLKLRSQADQLRVYQRLFELGLEGSMLTTVCPVATTGMWSSCPFRE